MFRLKLLDLVECSAAGGIPSNMPNLVDSSFGIRDSFTLVNKCKLLATGNGQVSR
jgi:hypothetical protein